jgi:hypothetical protein
VSLFCGSSFLPSTIRFSSEFAQSSLYQNILTHSGRFLESSHLCLSIFRRSSECVRSPSVQRSILTPSRRFPVSSFVGPSVFPVSSVFGPNSDGIRETPLCSPSPRLSDVWLSSVWTSEASSAAADQLNITLIISVAFGLLVVVVGAAILTVVICKRKCRPGRDSSSSPSFLRPSELLSDTVGGETTETTHQYFSTTDGVLVQPLISTLDSLPSKQTYDSLG